MTDPYGVRPWWNRREFLKGSVAVAAGAYGLSPSFVMAAPVSENFDGSAFKPKAPEPSAKSGGVLRHGMPLRAPHFDIHQAGTIFILGGHSLYVRQSDPARSQRWRQNDHPGSGAQLGDCSE